MKKINIEELKKLNYIEGEELLAANGYVKGDVCKYHIVQNTEYYEDTYFTLFDENENDVHTVSFYQYIIDDVAVKNTWEEL